MIGCSDVAIVLNNKASVHVGGYAFVFYHLFLTFMRCKRDPPCLCLCGCACARTRACVCVWVCMHACVYVCVCVCVCVWVCMNVCVRVCVGYGCGT